MVDADALADEWRDGSTYDEQYQVPMMYAMRWYPGFVSFEEADRYKCNGSTTLLYDNERERWGVGMTGGGMDLSPHLLATFVNLGKGVPAELASAIRLDYNAYVNVEEHKENCALLAHAYLQEATRSVARAVDLKPSLKLDTELQRHVKGLEKSIEQ